MPRKPKSAVNRSQAIRDYLAANASAKTAEIKEALAKNGIKVSDSLISAVKYKKPKGKRGKKRGRPAGAANVASVDSISVDSLVAIAKVVKQVGGIDVAAKAIGVLRRMQG